MSGGTPNRKKVGAALSVLFGKARKSRPSAGSVCSVKKAHQGGKEAIRVDTDLLKSKIPLKFLPGKALRILAKLAAITQHQKGDVLFKAGDSDDRSVFLVSGSVVLEASDGRNTTIMHDHQASLYALANLKPRRYRAKAGLDGTSVLWIKSEVLDQYLSEHKLSNGLDMGHYDVVSI